MSGPFRGLDEACPSCGRRTGDHTLDEYGRCTEKPAMDLPYENVPGGPIPLTINGNDMAWADHLHCRAALVEGFGTSVGRARMNLPTVIFTFEIGNPSGPAIPITEVAFVGTPEGLRRLGKVVRDSCNGAANAAERTA